MTVTASYTWSHVTAIAGTEAVGAGPSGAEVLVIDGDGYLNQPTSHTTGLIGGGGGAARPPANPAGYLIVLIGGSQFKVPYYNP